MVLKTYKSNEPFTILLIRIATLDANQYSSIRLNLIGRVENQ